MTLLYIGAVLIASLLIYGSRQISGFVRENVFAFRLKEIKISGNYLLSREEVLERCNIKQDNGILLQVDDQVIVRKLMQSPYIKRASAVYSLPSTLRISIEERQPIAFIYGRGLNLIDNEAVLIPVPHKSIVWNLPFITGIKGSLGTLGEPTTAHKARKAVKVLDYLHFIDSPLQQIISEISIDKSVVHLRLIKGGALVHINMEKYQDSLFVLSQYFKNYLDWNRLAVIEYIDLRFKDQLVIKEKRG